MNEVLSITNPIDPDDRPVSVANGKTGEMARWLLTMAVAGLVGYYSAQLTTERRVTAVEVKQEAQFSEVQRSLIRIEGQLDRLSAAAGR